MYRHKYRSANILTGGLLASAAALMLAGCGGGSSSSDAPVPAGSSQNQVPRISGNPRSAITAGAYYAFQPNASDADGDSLTYQVLNLPSWATFDPVTGAVTGTPTSVDVGTYSNIVIGVSDGTASNVLAGFSIAVTQIAIGSATISWLPPTQNTDGTPLVDLAGYRIYFGTNASNLTDVVTVTNPGLASFVVENLTAATWYFTVRAFTRNGDESGPSNLASKTIS